MTGPLTKFLWRHSHQLFELAVEMGESIETAAVGNLRDGVPAVAEHPACSLQPKATGGVQVGHLSR